MNIERPELASLPTPAPPEGLVLVINAGSSSPMAALSSAAGTPPFGAINGPATAQVPWQRFWPLAGAAGLWS